MTADLTLHRLFRNAARRHGPRPAVIFDGTILTHLELDALANRAANAFASLGVGAGTPVALMVSNCIEYVVADQALIRLGAVKVPLNDLLSDPERSYILGDSRAAVAIASPSQLDSARAALAGPGPLGAVVTVGTAPAGDGEHGWGELMAQHDDSPPEVPIDPAGVARLGYTGGTTGRPKGVVQTQESSAMNMLAHLGEMEITADDRLLLTSPLPHAAGSLLQAALLAGATTHIEPRFDLDVVLDRIERDRVSYVFMVPTMIYRLLDRVAAEPRDLGSLRTVLYGAAPITVERLRQGLELLGPVFMQLYGQSEAPMWLTRLGRDDHRTDEGYRHRLTSCGTATLLSEVRVVDDAGRDCPTGTVGEVVARTPFTMAGYHDLPELTARTIVDGWLHTGDMGRLDEDGYLYLVDRKNDMIISGGMNVYSSEVENCLAAHPSVAAVAVVGVPHPDWGEAVVAYIVPAAGPLNGLDTGALDDHCRAELAAYKRPKGFAIIDELPLTSIGKVDKQRLRADWPD